MRCLPGLLLVFVGALSCRPFSSSRQQPSQSGSASVVDTSGPDPVFASQCKLVTITQPNTVMYTVRDDKDCSNVAHPEPLGVGSVLENIGSDALPDPPLTGAFLVLRFTPDRSKTDYLKVCVAKTQVSCGDTAISPTTEAPQGGNPQSPALPDTTTSQKTSGTRNPSSLETRTGTFSSSVSFAMCPSTFAPKPRVAGQAVVCPRGYTLVETRRTWSQPWKDPDFFAQASSDAQTPVGRIDQAYGYACARPAARKTAKGYFMVPIRAFEVQRQDRDWHMECKYFESSCQRFLGCE
ncbi:MAG: hypothetical protein IOD12_06600 [Silvanigrellales bacterium]|nr:hypothetical protein [Silvanigrellales bacterium]